MSAPNHAGLKLLLRGLKLPSIAAHHDRVAVQAAEQGWSFEQYLHELVGIEVAERHQRRIERVLKSSCLPRDKTLETLELSRFPVPVRRQLPVLCEGDFVRRAVNVLVFGLPGRGKTHALCAIGHALVRRGVSVLFIAAFRLVQRLLVAKRELRLEQELRRLDRFSVVILDDIGYIQQEREEMEVLFTFLAERYERASVLISSNLVFSQWDRIFKDAMTTAAAIDRLVHHAVILELTGSSYRSEQARQRQEPRGGSATASADQGTKGGRAE